MKGSGIEAGDGWFPLRRSMESIRPGEERGFARRGRDRGVPAMQEIAGLHRLEVVRQMAALRVERPLELWSRQPARHLTIWRNGMEVAKWRRRVRVKRDCTMSAGNCSLLIATRGDDKAMAHPSLAAPWWEWLAPPAPNTDTPKTDRVLVVLSS